MYWKLRMKMLMLWTFSEWREKADWQLCCSSVLLDYSVRICHVVDIDACYFVGGVIFDRKGKHSQAQPRRQRRDNREHNYEIREKKHKADSRNHQCYRGSIGHTR